jgi:hypothetical protein
MRTFGIAAIRVAAAAQPQQAVDITSEPSQLRFVTLEFTELKK